MPRSSLSPNPLATRRAFVFAGAAALTASYGTLPQGALAETGNPNMLGPLPGYSPQIGTFVSQLTWLRERNGVLSATGPLKQTDLDYLFDKNANTIGALMLHLAATETYYQMNTFDGMKWGSWSADIKKKWDPAMNRRRRPRHHQGSRSRLLRQHSARGTRKNVSRISQEG
jgi:hypothetical protein